ncbi:putative ankyrin repeat domain-containing protein 31 [Trichoplax sp. H2]|nr:putative ankyrin repeat domain-containing protein 31 [Trichoplax sp. H2]|eukprot:RDD42833.1 putative ankyrin repeat domain-containing protein 31 [Trichoplax sp. H2]
MPLSVKGKTGKLQFIGFTNIERRNLASKYKKLDGKIGKSKTLLTQTTHIICERPETTNLFLAACVRGIWILKKSFIEDSAEAGYLLAEREYEWSIRDHHNYPAIEEGLLQAPQYWRLKKEKGLTLFPEKTTAVVYGSDSEKENQFEKILKWGGVRCTKPEIFQQSPTPVDYLFYDEKHSYLKRQYESYCKIGRFPTKTITERILQQPFQNSTWTENTNNPSETKKRKDPDYLSPINALPVKRVATENPDTFDYTKKLVRPNLLRIPICKDHDQICLDRLFLLYAVESKHQKGDENLKVMPSTEVSQFGTHLDHQNYYPAIEIAKKCLLKYYPPSSVLHDIMTKLITESNDDLIMNEGFGLLTECLQRYPPKMMRMKKIYMLSFCTDRSINQYESCSVETINMEMWNNIMQKIENVSKKEEKCDVLILRFIVQLLWTDYKIFYDGLIGKKEKKDDRPIFFSLLWPGNFYQTASVSQKSIELMDAFFGVYQQSSDLSDDCINLIHSLLILSGDCCARQEMTSYYKSNNTTILGDYAIEFAIKLAGKIDQIKDSKRKLALLESLALDWLVACVSEYILLTFHHPNNLNSGLQDAVESLSLQKIVKNYFELIPYGRQLLSNDKRDISSAVSKGTIIEKRNAKGETRLHVACKRNDVGTIEALIGEGAEVNVVDNCGWTPLHEACNHGHIDAVHTIIKCSQKYSKDLNFSANGDGGITPMHDAILNEHYEVAKVLMQYGGGYLLKHKGNCQLSPLDLSIDESVVKELKDFADNIEKTTKKYVVRAESCELYLTALANLIDVQITQYFIQERFKDKERGDDTVFIQENVKHNNQRLSNSRNIMKDAFNNLPRLEKHISSIIERQDKTEKCKLLLAKINLDLWQAMKT